jgi:hypothetical protein
MWNGVEWEAMGLGFDRDVKALCVHRDTLYAGGLFSEAEGLPAPGVAFWDGAAWRGLGVGVEGLNASVEALASYRGELVLGGTFNAFGGLEVHNIVRWDGATASPLEGPYLEGTGPIEALCVFNDDLIAGGPFTFAGGPGVGVAAWNGQDWRSIGDVGGGTFPSVWGLAVISDQLYVGGYFERAGWVEAHNVARWDGTHWYPLGEGTSMFPLTAGAATVRCFGGVPGSVWVGGEFLTAGNVYTPAMAHWNGVSWSPAAPGAGVPGLIGAMTPYEDGVVVGGLFPWAGTPGDTRNLAFWDGESWQSLASAADSVTTGPDSSVAALAVFGGDLIAAGRFQQIGTQQASRIARWDGERWSPMGEGFNGRVFSLLSFEGTLYAGGGFTQSGAVSVDHVAQWNGQQWSPVGLGLHDAVLTLDIDENTLVAGGNFAFSGTTPVARIARWNGSAWTPLGQGVDFSVRCIQAFQGDLLAGGFSGSGSLGHLARWDGSTWAPAIIGPSVIIEINDLIDYHGRLVVGGLFREIGGVQARNLATFDGTIWDALGGGADNVVFKLIQDANDLVVGGGFSIVGDVGSASFAIWSEEPTDVDVYDLAVNRVGRSVALSWRLGVDAMRESRGLAVQRAESQEGPFGDRTTELLLPQRTMSFVDDADYQPYWYRLILHDNAGGAVVVGPVSVGAGTLTAPALTVARVNNSWRIEYAITTGPAHVELGIYDVRGRRVGLLEDAKREAGSYIRHWESGNASSGVYFVRLVVDGRSFAEKLTAVD